MISESEIRNALEAVAQNRISVWDFADWMDSKSWGMHRDSSAGAIRFASSVDRVLAEYDYHRNESALRCELLSLIGNKPVVVRIRIKESSISFAKPAEWFGSANSGVGFLRPVQV